MKLSALAVFLSLLATGYDWWVRLPLFINPLNSAVSAKLDGSERELTNLVSVRNAVDGQGENLGRLGLIPS